MGALAARPGGAGEALTTQGYLEQGLDQYFVNAARDDFQRGVWTQGYRLDLGGNLGLPFVETSDFGADYSSGQNQAQVVVAGQGPFREQFGWHARSRLALARFPQVAFSPQFSRVKTLAALPGDPNLASLDSSEGASLDLNLPLLPSYTALWRRSRREIDDGVRERAQTTEFSERAVWRRGRFGAEYERRTQEAKDELAAGRDLAWDSMSLLADLADAQFQRLGLRSYSAQAAYRQWGSGRAGVRDGQQSLAGSLFADSLAWEAGPLATSLRLGETYSGLQPGSSGAFSHLAALQSRLERGGHFLSNRLEANWSGPGIRATESLNASLRAWERRIESQWSWEESYQDNGLDFWWRDLLSHRLNLKAGAGVEFQAGQEYSASRQALGPSRDQSLGFSGGASWTPSPLLRLGGTWRSSFQSSFQAGQESRQDNGSLELRVAPLVGLDASLQYWLFAGEPGGALNQSVSGELNWRLLRSLELKTALHYAGDARNPRLALLTASPSSYLNYEAGLTYGVGRTEFKLSYRHNEKDFANAYDQAGISAKRTF